MEASELEAHVALAVAGDREAISLVITAVRPAVFRYCLARFGQRETAEDVTQEVCIAVLKALPRFHQTAVPFTAYVFGIAARQTAMAYRSSGRRHEQVTNQLPDPADPSAGPAELAERRAGAGWVRSLVAALPEQQQNIVLMRVAGGLSAEEVAAALGMTAGAVRVAQHRALARLRDQLAVQGQR